MTKTNALYSLPDSINNAKFWQNPTDDTTKEEDAY